MSWGGVESEYSSAPFRSLVDSPTPVFARDCACFALLRFLEEDLPICAKEDAFYYVRN